MGKVCCLPSISKGRQVSQSLGSVIEKEMTWDSKLGPFAKSIGPSSAPKAGWTESKYCVNGMLLIVLRAGSHRRPAIRE